MAYSPTKNIKIPLCENLVDFQFFKRKSYQQKIGGNLKFRAKYEKMVTEYSRNFEYLRTIVERDYPTYTGKILERYFTEKFATQHLYSVIGTYWEKGNQNEIDIIAVNDFNRTVLVAEIKRKKENISIPLLEEKGKNLQSQLKGYTFEYQGLSIDDV